VEAPNTPQLAEKQAVKHELKVWRTARYYTLGKLTERTREVWFVLHGYGMLARYFLKRFEPIANETRLIVAPEGLSRFYLGEGYSRAAASWMTKEDREAEIADQQGYLQAVFAELMPGGLSDNVQINILGFSQGTATAWRWVCSGNVPFTNLILWAGSIPLDPPPTGMLLGKGFHLLLGEQDEIIPKAIAEDFLKKLAESGVSPTVHWYTGGHTVDETALLELVDKHLVSS
jgi:predicted esterase